MGKPVGSRAPTHCRLQTCWNVTDMKSVTQWPTTVDRSHQGDVGQGQCGTEKGNRIQDDGSSSINTYVAGTAHSGRTGVLCV